MADGFDVLHVKSAVNDRSKMTVHRSHQTTMNFGQLAILWNEELVPTDRFSVPNTIFSRCAPLVVPSYMKAELKTATFWVPYYQIAKDADAWLSGNSVYRGKNTHQRWFTNEAIFSLFSGSRYATPSSPTGRVDFKYVNSSGAEIGMTFTSSGKYYYKLFRQLGYAIPSEVDLRSSSYWMTKLKDKKFSAYPLLAFFKAYNDWMFQSQQFNSALLTQLLYSIKLGVGETNYYDHLTGEVKKDALDYFFTSLYVLFQNDLFTSAWRYPNSPMGNDTTDAQISYIGNPTTNFQVKRSMNNDYYALNQDNSISQRSLDFLKRFDSWTRRNNYAGSVDTRQTLARFGIKTEDYQSHFASVIDRTTYPLQIGDVTSTAMGSDGTELGSYAGKGIISSSGKFEFKSSDHGLLFQLAWIAVTPIYPDAVDKKVLRTNHFDYFTPEFDAVGPEAISIAEVYENNKYFNPSLNPKHSDDVYGFTERYNSYRLGARSQVTGDFMIYEGMDAWHAGRDLRKIRNSQDMIAMSPSMVYMNPVDSEFNRIFQYTDGEMDMFYVTANYEVHAQRPMKNLSGAANLGEGNEIIERNGNNIQ